MLVGMGLDTGNNTMSLVRMTGSTRRYARDTFCGYACEISVGHIDWFKVRFVNASLTIER